ncbi:MAG: PKD domain-containing protein, partial [Bacteroidetes bacterium]
MRRLIYWVALLGLAPTAWAQPVAQFTADPLTGCAPMVVSFTDQSQQAVAWFWDTGIGTSNLQNPSFFFAQPGTYTVTLIVTDAGGAKDTLVKTDYLTVYSYPTADFAAAQTTVCAHEPLAFTDLSSPGTGVLTQWTWDFGDGATSTDQHPVHTFASPGVYPVSLVVENDAGCGDDELKTTYITVQAPDAAFWGDSLMSCGPPLPVQFVSVGGAGQHQWLFGDGGTAGIANPAHSYSSYGTYTVTHMVQDALGCRDTVVKPNYINIGVNTLSASASDSTVCKGDTIFFTTNASLGSTVTWDFDDGTTASGRSVFRKYPAGGQYDVQVSIDDPSGCQRDIVIPVEVFDYPVVDFTVAD